MSIQFPHYLKIFDKFLAYEHWLSISVIFEYFGGTHKYILSVEPFYHLKQKERNEKCFVFFFSTLNCQISLGTKMCFFKNFDFFHSYTPDSFENL